MARKWMNHADESSSARLITVPYEYLPIGAPIRPGKSPRQEPFEKRKT